jgi:GrpB-like predicted nucleotidyltransferase (UPF0157 family)
MERDIDRRRKYSFKRYSPVYAMLFVRERKKLARCLGKTTHIEHIGSTAVPGLGGKNVLDIMVGRPHTHFQKQRDRLKGLGYVFHSEDGSKNRSFFVRDTSYNGRRIRIHLHLTNLKSKDWTEALAFRNYLRANRKSLLAYAAVKRRAARIANGVKERYIKEKSAFIETATHRALADKRTEKRSR